MAFDFEHGRWDGEEETTGFTFPDRKTGPTKTVVFDQEHCTANDEVAFTTNGVTLETRPPLTQFEKELKQLINKHCIENESNTPDLILAEYLAASLAAFNVATKQRETWYGRKVF